jgi:hypothetical protein
MIELMRDTGGSIEQISTSKYVHRIIDNVLDRLMDDGAPKLNRLTSRNTPKTQKKK